MGTEPEDRDGFEHAPPWSHDLLTEIGRQIGTLRAHIDRKFHQQQKEIAKLMSDVSSAQADINAQAAAIGALSTQLGTINTALTDLVNEVDALKKNNPTIDTSALNTAVTTLSSSLNTLASTASTSDPGAPAAPVAPPAAPTP